MRFVNKCHHFNMEKYIPYIRLYICDLFSKNFEIFYTAYMMEKIVQIGTLYIIDRS